MKCYRLKHKPTGLYYCPAREVIVHIPDKDKKRRCHVKSNLSKKGKIYSTKPSITRIGENFYNHLETTKKLQNNLDATYRLRTYVTPTFQSDWEIEEI